MAIISSEQPDDKNELFYHLLEYNHNQIKFLGVFVALFSAYIIWQSFLLFMTYGTEMPIFVYIFILLKILSCVMVAGAWKLKKWAFYLAYLIIAFQICITIINNDSFGIDLVLIIIFLFPLTQLSKQYVLE